MHLGRYKPWFVREKLCLVTLLSGASKRNARASKSFGRLRTLEPRFDGSLPTLEGSTPSRRVMSRSWKSSEAGSNEGAWASNVRACASCLSCDNRPMPEGIEEPPASEPSEPVDDRPTQTGRRRQGPGKCHRDRAALQGSSCHHKSRCHYRPAPPQEPVPPQGRRYQDPLIAERPALDSHALDRDRPRHSRHPCPLAMHPARGLPLVRHARPFLGRPELRQPASSGFRPARLIKPRPFDGGSPAPSSSASSDRARSARRCGLCCRLS